MKERLIKIGSWLYVVFIVALSVGTIVISFTNNTGGPFILYGFVGGFAAVIILALLWLVALPRVTEENVERFLQIAPPIMLVAMFFSSWVVYSNDFAILETQSEIRLLDRETIVILVPYTQKVSYISGFTAKTIATLLLNNEGEVRWEISANFKLIANYNEVFALLRRFKNKANWMAEVQRIFEKAVNQYVSANFNPSSKAIPKNFSFSLEEQREEFAPLGFEPEGEAVAKEVSRIIYKESTLQSP